MKGQAETLVEQAVLQLAGKNPSDSRIQRFIGHGKWTRYSHRVRDGVALGVRDDKKITSRKEHAFPDSSTPTECAGTQGRELRGKVAAIDSDDYVQSLDGSINYMRLFDTRKADKLQRQLRITLKPTSASFAQEGIDNPQWLATRQVASINKPSV